MGSWPGGEGSFINCDEVFGNRYADLMELEAVLFGARVWSDWSWVDFLQKMVPSAQLIVELQWTNQL